MELINQGTNFCIAKSYSASNLFFENFLHLIFFSKVLHEHMNSIEIFDCLETMKNLICNESLNPNFFLLWNLLLIILHYIFNEIISGFIHKSCEHGRWEGVFAKCPYYKMVHKGGSGSELSKNLSTWIMGDPIVKNILTKIQNLERIY